MKQIRVLVTGAGSGVGQSIMKALKISKLPVKIISADINALNAGLFRADKSLIVPKVENRIALSWYIKNLKKLKIDVLMIGSEYDLLFFSKNKNLLEEKTNCKICVTDIETVKIAEDKFLTQKFLKEKNLPYLKTFVLQNLKKAIKIGKKLGFPFYLKSRFGTSAKNVHLIKNTKELKSFFHLVKKPILQEYAGYLTNKDLENEYTCSFFTTLDNRLIGPFIAKRKLLFGTSWITEVKEFPKVAPLVIKIANKLKNYGSMNIQLRLGRKGPIPFEFNARFSGTTSIRAHFGFNEPEMYLRNYYLNKKIKKPKIKKGVCLRYVEEIFANNVNLNNINKKFSKGEIKNWF